MWKHFSFRPRKNDFATDKKGVQPNKKCFYYYNDTESSVRMYFLICYGNSSSIFIFLVDQFEGYGPLRHRIIFINYYFFRNFLCLAAGRSVLWFASFFLLPRNRIIIDLFWYIHRLGIDLCSRKFPQKERSSTIWGTHE